MSDLRSTIQSITNQFVSSILGAMRSASLSDLVGQTGGAPKARPGRPARAATAVAAPSLPSSAKPARSRGRRRRSSAAEVQKLKDAALAAAKALKGGFSKGDVMKKSGSKTDLGRALSLLVNERKLTRKGDRRLARYWVK